MCVEPAPGSGCKNTSCGCGGYERLTAPPDPCAILTLKFGEEAEHKCNCSGRTCPRHYLAASGLVLGAFLVLHLAINALGLWPEIFQAAVNRNHAMGALLPVLEVGLVFLPLSIHVALGLRTLRREKLSLGVEKQHVGSDVPYWLQRLTAVILLVFLAFHLATMHRWGFHLVYQISHWPALGRYAAGGLFMPQRAFASVSEALWHFWDKHAANPANWLILQLYLLGLASAVFHLANGVATGTEVLGFVPARRAEGMALAPVHWSGFHSC